MRELTITGRIELRAPGRRSLNAATPVDAAPPPSRPSRLAQMLALSYRIEALIDGGVLKDHADAARRLGITRARMSQIASLYLLPTRVQEDILLGRTITTERTLRSARSSVDGAPLQV